MTHDIVWDCETYQNVFTISAHHAHLPIEWSFEISDWRNDSRAIIEWVMWIGRSQDRCKSDRGVPPKSSPALR